MEDPTVTPADISKIQLAISEVMAKKGVFSKDTYTQIVLALYDRLRLMQTNRPRMVNQSDLPPEDEIRLVTVMFVDVVDATHMAEQLEDDEEWRLLIGDAHRRLAATVQLWDGEIGQYLGDGLLCYFGARRSQGNDAARAVACALAIQERMADYHLHVQEHYDLPSFQVRIGISTGRAVVGPIGDADQMTTLAVGSTTNLASRLQNLAPGGGIIIDNETYLRVRTDFITVQQEDTAVRGFDEPIVHYLVVGQKLQTTTQLTTDRIGDIPVPFIGRRSEYQQILRQMQLSAANRRLHSLTLIGDIGLGKSRLLQEIAQSSTADNFYIVRMVGHYERSKTAFSLLRDMLFTQCDLAHTLTPTAAEDRILQYTRDNWQDNRRPEVPAAIVGYLAGYGFSESIYIKTFHRNELNTDDQLSYQWVREWLRGLAGEKPLLILVDNLQWADDRSLALLESFKEDTQFGTMILGAARPEFKAQHPLYMKAHDNHTDIRLSPLSTDKTQQIIKAVLTYVPDTPLELSNLIADRAEGNPLFVEEFLRMLFDSGVFERDENNDKWRVNSFRYRTMESSLPNGLLGVFQARLDDLDSSVRRVVQIASVVGRTFWEGAVRSVAQVDVASKLQELISRNIIIEKPRSRIKNDREFVFRNTLYYEVAYSMLPRTYRTAYHQQVAEWFGGHVGTNQEMLGKLAVHYTHAERPLEALRTYTRAAEYQFEAGALPKALSLIDDGLFAARSVPREDAISLVSQLWLIQARALHARHRYSESTAASQTALMLMNEIPEDRMAEERVLASVTLGNAYISLGSYDEALNALTDAYRFVDDTDDMVQKSTVLRSFGTLHWSQGNLDEAERFQHESHTASLKSGNSRETAASMSMLARTALDRGDFAKALDLLEQVLIINQETENLLYQVSDLYLIAMIHRLLFKYSYALIALNNADEIAGKIGYDAPLLKAERGLCYIQQNHIEKGMELLKEASQHTYLNMVDRYSVQLAYIQGLAQVKQYATCIKESESFLVEVQKHNRVLYGRGLLWYGLAQHKLGEEQALMTLRWAEDNEITYGGRDIWLCYYALSLAYPDYEDASHYSKQAKHWLQTIAASLHNRPELAASVVDPDHMATVFGGWLPHLHRS